MKLIFKKKKIVIIAAVLVLLGCAAYFILKFGRFMASTSTGSYIIKAEVAKTEFDPAKESLGLKWTLTEPASTTITVKDSTGKLIQTVYQSKNEKGLHSTCWDGTTNVGPKAGAGSYKVIFKAYVASKNANYIDQFTVKVSSSGTSTGGGTTPPDDNGGGTTTGQISIKSIVPTSITPVNGDKATITYTVPKYSRYKIYVENKYGQYVTGIVTYSDMAAGTYTRVWDGKDPYGKQLPVGNYYIVVAEDVTGSSLGTAKMLMNIAS